LGERDSAGKNQPSYICLCQQLCFRSSVRLSVRLSDCLTVRLSVVGPSSCDAIWLYFVDRFQWNLLQIFKYSSYEWALLMRFTRSESKVKVMWMCECYTGGGIHFDGVAVASRLTAALRVTRRFVAHFSCKFCKLITWSSQRIFDVA